jgi:hypothetical protein
MDEAILNNRLKDLVRYVNSLDMPWPNKSGGPGVANAVPVQCSRRNAQDLLDSLGFSVKYLIFDLEATRRENEILRSIITKDGE